MTRRAALLLDALADGPLSRRRIFDHTGFMMVNNAAAELRASGYDVSCELVRGEYVYAVEGRLNDGLRDYGAELPPSRSEEPIVEAEQLVLA